LGARLRALRERAGLTQKALADRAGLGIATLWALERGSRRRPHPDTLGRLSKALGLATAEHDALFEIVYGDLGQRPTPRGPQVAHSAPAPERLDRLPRPATPLFGREAELADLRQMLDPASRQARFVTLVGPGGVGKTRLALAVASELLDVYRDGVVFVDLSPVRDSHLVPTTIARALDVQESSSASDRQLVLNALGARRLLLVLDNFEHVRGAAPLIGEVLQACAQVAILATSRIVLRLRAERLFAVEPLLTPSEQDESDLNAVGRSPAVRLFVDRAQKVTPGFDLQSGTAAAVAALCRRLEGLPLAIELAAARAGLLGPDALLKRLERRLPLLTGGAPDLPARQQTLRATLEWSHDLLAPVEQTLFRRLAVFAGGCTLDAVEAVCGAVDLGDGGALERLQVLVDSSLVRREHTGQGEARFGMLEAVREYAEERLVDAGELESVHTRHRDWYVAYAEQAEPALTGPDQLRWYGRFTAELGNFRAARAWSRRDAAGREAGLRLAAALSRYLWVRASGDEGRAWLGEALAEGPPEPTAARARVLTFCGQLDHLHDQDRLGRARLEEAVAIARVVGDPALRCLTLRILALFSADPAEAGSLLAEAVLCARAAGDQRELAFALSFLAKADHWRGDVAEAFEHSTQAVTAAEASGDASAQADARLRLTSALLVSEDFAAAHVALQEALQLSQTLGNHYYVSVIHWQLAGLALARSELAVAQAHVRSSIEAARASGPSSAGLRPLQVAARIVLADGHADRGARWLAAVAGWQRHQRVSAAATPLWSRWDLPDDEAARAAALRAARLALGEEAFASTWTTGLRLALDEALHEALAGAG
jgi:predicted ATPase/DNA-binding XRE family transcriptional regulator